MDYFSPVTLTTDGYVLPVPGTTTVLSLFVCYDYPLLYSPCYAHHKTMSWFQEIVVINLLCLCSLSVIPPILPSDSPVWKSPSPKLQKTCLLYVQCWPIEFWLRGRQSANTNKNESVLIKLIMMNGLVIFLLSSLGLTLHSFHKLCLFSSFPFLPLSLPPSLSHSPLRVLLLLIHFKTEYSMCECPL